MYGTMSGPVLPPLAPLIDAKNEKVARWYVGYGAVPLLDASLSLLLPLATIEAALKKGSRKILKYECGRAEIKRAEYPTAETVVINQGRSPRLSP